MKNQTFNDFCYKICDGLYTPGLPDDMQCTGYLQLKKMVIDNITPASLSEMERWENNPSTDELIAIPNIKYLRFLHKLLRPFIIENWSVIKNLKINNI